jgi:protein-S-isoprenylcysteine O-methyltransferase Ste14
MYNDVMRKNLVSWGPFRVMRHPMHGSFLFFVLGGIALRLNWLFTSLMLLSWICGVFALQSEEEQLVAKYGEEYIRYKQKVGAFLPCVAWDCGVSIEQAHLIATDGDPRSPLLAKGIN